jgi:hypothetical protein
MFEGTSCQQLDGCSKRGLEFPRFEQTHSELCAIIGGYVYRGHALGRLTGKYVYADACTGSVWALDLAAEGADPELIARARTSIGSLAEDSEGELYVVETKSTKEDHVQPLGGFQVLKLVPAAMPESSEAAATPLSLSQTGCIGRRGFRAPPPGMIAYSLNVVPWEEGAETHRFTTIHRMREVWGTDVETLAPPVGSILLKTYVLEDRPVETQILARRSDGRWEAFDFRWRDDATDADLVTAPVQARIASDRIWHFPGSSRCVLCHNTGVGMIRGLTVTQLNRERDGDNQIARLEALGSLVWPWKGGALARLPPLDDESASIEDRVRAYFHVNCAHCHQPGGQAAGTRMDLRRETPLALAGVCGEAPAAVFPGHEEALLVSPGKPDASLVSIRMRLAGPGAMPPDRQAVDPLGTKLVDAWIRSLEACPVSGSP